MKKSGILHAQLIRNIAELGHFDSFVICDMGFPIPKGSEIVDLCLTRGLVSVRQALDAVLTEVVVQDAVMVDGIHQANPQLEQNITAKLYRQNLDWYKEEIGKCTTREFTTGFYFGKPGEDAQIYQNSTYIKSYIYLGTVETIGENGLVQIEQKNKFSVGETLEIMKPDGRNLMARVRGIYSEEGETMESAPHARQKLFLDLSEPAEPGNILRIKERECL